MIAYLKGMIAAKDAYGIVLDVQGVGYAIQMSAKSLAELPPSGGSARVWTSMQVKDDGVTLYGFADVAEKEMFERLIEVSGVGPKIAIAALSSYGAGELGVLIGAGDVTAITRIPGIGKKTAQRVVLELQGILQAEPAAVLPGKDGGELADASEALMGMGFAADEVAAALKDIPAEGMDAAKIIRLALRNMGGKR